LTMRFCAARKLVFALIAGGIGQCAHANVADADPVADFYRGRTLRIVVGYAAGGGYDIYARVFAEQIGKYLPGKPTVLAQNMPGAGSFVAAKYLHDVAPRDGTTFGCVSQTLPLDAALARRSDFDVTAMPYIGRLVDNVDIGIGYPGAPFESFADARAREIVVGATGGASPGYLLPAALIAHAGAKFKIVTGYGGSSDILLAMERREVQLGGGIGLPGVIQRHPDWIVQRKAPVLYQAALNRHPLLPAVPTLGELGSTPEDAQVLKAISGASNIGRAIITTPGVPADRLEALRSAFDAMAADRELIELMRTRGLEFGPASGREIDAIAQNIARTPRPVLDRIERLVASASK